MIFDKYLYSKDKILNALYEENQIFLLEALQNDKIDKNLKFDWGEPLLNQVLKYGYGLVFKKMIEKNVDVNQADSEGVTPVMVVGERNKHHFLDDSALNRLDQQNEFFFTLLKQAGADFNRPDNQGVVPLERLINQSLPEGWRGVVPFGYIDDFDTYQSSAELLLKFGADINYKNEKGQTPLFAAVSQRSLKAVTFLIQKGAKIDEQDEKGQTALMKAVQDDSLKDAKFKNGFPVCVSNLLEEDERTIKNVIERRGLSIIDYLLSKTSDFCLKDKRGDDIYSLAMKSSNHAVAKLILNSLKIKMRNQKKQGGPFLGAQHLKFLNQKERGYA